MKSILSCAILLAVCRMAVAQSCCDHCGECTSCCKVCRVVREIAKVPKVTYDCECEEFCVPGPSVRSTVCDECGCKRHVYTPTCGKLRTRTKMIKHTTYEEKVVYRWVVEHVCCDCAENSSAAGDDAESFAARGAAPKPDAVQPAAYRAPIEPVGTPPQEVDESRPDASSKISLRRLFKPLTGRR